MTYKTTVQLCTIFPIVDANSFTTEEQKAWRTFLHASSRLMSQLDDEMRATHGEPLATFDVLSNLSEAPKGELRMSELADQTLFSRSRLSYTVGQLEERGLVKRQTDPDDRRGVSATLTPKGVAHHQRLARTHLEGIREHFLEPTTPTTRSDLSDALAPILKALAVTTTGTPSIKEASRRSGA
jgi:DNA-binding MarR family transcriptional regulator